MKKQVGIYKIGAASAKLLIDLIEFDHDRGKIDMSEKRFLISRISIYRDTGDIKYLGEFNKMLEEIHNRGGVE